MIKWSRLFKDPENIDIDKVYWITFFFLLFGIGAFSSLYLMFENALNHLNGEYSIIIWAIFQVMLSLPFGLMSWIYKEKAIIEGW